MAFARTVMGDVGRPTLAAVRGDVPTGKVTLAVAQDEAGELAGIVRAIEARVTGGRSYGDQAVLCRTRRQVRRVAEALAGRGVPVDWWPRCSNSQRSRTCWRSWHCWWIPMEPDSCALAVFLVTGLAGKMRWRC